MKRKIAKGFGVICKSKRMLKKETLVKLYYSFVYPYLQYGVIAWGSTYTKVIDPIIKLQKKVVRVISSSDWNSPSDPIFKSLNILPAHKIYILNVLLLMYKVYLCKLPDVFGNMFIRNSDVHSYFTRQSDNYHVSTWRLEIVRRSKCKNPRGALLEPNSRSNRLLYFLCYFQISRQEISTSKRFGMINRPLFSS